MMLTGFEKRAEQVSCPVKGCGAQQGQHCRTAKLRNPKKPHVQRTWLVCSHNPNAVEVSLP
jgi:hypothetical protein